MVNRIAQAPHIPGAVVEQRDSWNITPTEAERKLSPVA